MLKILEACTYLAKLSLRSFGVFLVLHMVEKTSSEGSSELPDCVYSLHGIRTDAFWQSGLSEQIRSRTGFKVGYRNYLRFELLMFVLKNIFSYKPLHLIAGDIRDLQRDYRVNVIAHSFGTWLLLKALSENGELRIHNLILCGAVFPRALSRWRQLKHDTRQITGEIVNFCGMRDPFPALAELLSRDFGASGVVGAGDPVIQDSFHDVGHSGFLTTTFCRQNWIEILMSKPFTPQPASRKPYWYISLLLRASAHRGMLALVFLALTFGTYRFIRSESSCYIRSCYVDIVRIHNFASSTRVAGTRRYVDQITFEYTYNFDRNDLVFRAPKDRGPTVTSLIGDQLSPITVSTESTEPLIVANEADRSPTIAYHLPVRDRRAYFSVEFANSSAESPDGIEIFADQTIRNLRLQILKPTDIRLVAPKNAEFRNGILIDRQPQSPSSASRCEFASDGTEVRCTDLYIPRSHGFFYCFLAEGWNQLGEIPAPKTPGCKQEAAAEQK
jgi:hypothetical protein